jgi:hypothetical protein
MGYIVGAYIHSEVRFQTSIVVLCVPWKKVGFRVSTKRSFHYPARFPSEIAHHPMLFCTMMWQTGYPLQNIEAGLSIHQLTSGV